MKNANNLLIGDVLSLTALLPLSAMAQATVDGGNATGQAEANSAQQVGAT